MATLTDDPSFTVNEVYEIAGTDNLSGAFTGAEFEGLGNLNQPHQSLANRTAFLKGRQDTNISNIAALQLWKGLFTSALGPNGWMKLGVMDAKLGQIGVIIQWGYNQLADQKIANDIQFPVVFTIPFPNAILFPPLATNVYASTSGFNTVASVISYSKSGALFVLDVPGGIGGIGPTNEHSNGFSWLAIGY